jgi:hypothetical protein
MRGQRTADPPLGEVRQVEGEVAPPCAVVVPEVMIRVGAGDPDGDSARVHNASTFRQTHQGVHCTGTKPLIPVSGGGFVVREGFGFEASSASHIGRDLFARAPWLASTARLLLTRLSRFVPDAVWQSIIGPRRSQGEIVS